MFRIKRGLDLPIEGQPAQRIEATKLPTRVGIVGTDYLGLKPSILVNEGDRVQRGQPVIGDRKNPGVMITAPCTGTVKAVNRGERRVFVSLEIDVDPAAADAASADQVTFPQHAAADLGQLARDEVTARLAASGLWVAMRTRPYDKVPMVGTVPHSIFVNAMDSNPLAPDMDVVLAGREDALRAGVTVLTRLTDGPVFVCRDAASKQPRIQGVDRVSEQAFSGPHPAGLVGTHIHFLDPVGPKKTVWHLGAQDAVAIGELFLTGRLDVARVVALCGPQVGQPRLLRTVIGASTDDLTRGEVREGENRIVSGSALHGAECAGQSAYLGRYSQQVTVLLEGRERKFLRYVQPGFDMHSVSNMVLGKLSGKRLPMTTTSNGSPRAMVPIGSYEAVMPLDMQPTFLLRYLIVGDTDRAVALGALELGEEDLALCTYACPGKYEYGPILRDVLNRIELEG